MSLSLLQSTFALAPGGLTVPFGATGGTAPYTYSVAPGGAGGAINASSGVYISPNTTGADVVIVTDSVAATASGTVLVDVPIMLVCDVLQRAMGLASGQVYLYNQKINIPNDSRLYIAVGLTSCKPFGNRPKYDGSGGGLNAIQSVNMQATLSIDIFSRSTAALLQKEQVLLALSSPYATQQMELNSFYIAPISVGFVNLSALDGPAIPYRFNISVNIQYFTTLTTATAYYDTFSNVVVTTES